VMGVVEIPMRLELAYYVSLAVGVLLMVLWIYSRRSLDKVGF
jgi:hypothetical protein